MQACLGVNMWLGSCSALKRRGHILPVGWVGRGWADAKPKPVKMRVLSIFTLDSALLWLRGKNRSHSTESLNETTFHPLGPGRKGRSLASGAERGM